MAKLGLVNLPPQKHIRRSKTIKPLTLEEVTFEKPPIIITSELNHSTQLYFIKVNDVKEAQLWRYLIQRYHYLGYKIIVGRYLKYFVYLDNKTCSHDKSGLVALLGFARRRKDC